MTDTTAKKQPRPPLFTASIAIAGLQEALDEAREKLSALTLLIVQADFELSEIRLAASCAASFDEAMYGPRTEAVETVDED